LIGTRKGGFIATSTSVAPRGRSVRRSFKGNEVNHVS
jgi:hypothetical protein